MDGGAQFGYDISKRNTFIIREWSAGNVQAALQALGDYHGPIDGLLSLATREALANYQRDQGLYATSAIDEATLAALGMA